MDNRGTGLVNNLLFSAGTRVFPGIPCSKPWSPSTGVGTGYLLQIISFIGWMARPTAYQSGNSDLPAILNVWHIIYIAVLSWKWYRVHYLVAGAPDWLSCSDSKSAASVFKHGFFQLRQKLIHLNLPTQQAAGPRKTWSSKISLAA
jgi:hypothetical protein